MKKVAQNISLRYDIIVFFMSFMRTWSPKIKFKNSECDQITKSNISILNFQILAA